MGIVPIINRFLDKKVPSYTAVPFLVTAPDQSILSYSLRPIQLLVIPFQMVLLRALGVILIATILGLFLGFFWKNLYKEKD